MEKRGQFYIIAAIAIVVILFSAATLMNSSKREEYFVVYDLTKEVDVESSNLKEYGVIQGEELQDIFQNFSERYLDYMQDPAIEVHFIYGDSSDAYVFSKNYESGSFVVGGSTLTIQSGQGNKQRLREGLKPGDKIEVSLKVGEDNISPKIEVKEKEFFYYIFVQKTTDGEVHITGAQDEK